MGAGKLVIIGGGEDKKGPCVILRKFLQLAGGREARLVIITAATEYPRQVGEEYRKVFARLGCNNMEIMDVPDRAAANSPKPSRLLRESTGCFFTGGDQLRITSALGGTQLLETLRKIYEKGVVIAGTSAGASAMSSTMIIEGVSEESPQLNRINMSPGMGLFPEAVIDQHFAQRGRIGRLLLALGQNPSILGLGIDEDTAVLVEGESLSVLGSRTVTILDGAGVTHTNASTEQQNKCLALTHVTLHILPQGYSYNYQERSWGKIKTDHNG